MAPPSLKLRLKSLFRKIIYLAKTHVYWKVSHKEFVLKVNVMKIRVQVKWKKLAILALGAKEPGPLFSKKIFTVYFRLNTNAIFWVCVTTK